MSLKCYSRGCNYSTKWTRGRGREASRYKRITAYLYQGSELPSHRALLSQLPRVSTMEAEIQLPEGQRDTILALENAIEASNPAKVSSFPPAKAVFGSVSTLLTLIKTVCFPLSWNDLLQVHTQLG
jgi:hypothetical protein